MPRPLPLRTDFELARDSAFSYACRACGRCCKDKVIPLNPYEVARIAELLGTTTTEVLATHTAAGGATLRTRDEGTCVFFGASGCTVHVARPLACRLYPLGRYVDTAGVERFAEVTPHPESEGVYGEDGTVDAFLRAQGAGPYLDASARYVAALRKLLPVLTAREDAAEAIDEAKARMGEPPALGEENLLDVDAVVAADCARRGAPVPATVEGRVAAHVAWLEALAGEPERG